MVEKKSKKADAAKESAAAPKPELKASEAKKAVAPKKNETAKPEAAALKEGHARDIGVPVLNPPTLVCSDKNCAYHGQLSVRGRIFEGTVISDKMDKGVVVEWDYLQPLPKYKRFMRKKSRVAAHNPPCINAHTGDVVRIAECRPLSKTKSFVVIEIKK